MTSSADRCNTPANALPLLAELRSHCGPRPAGPHSEARAGSVPAVHSAEFKWNQLPALNAQIKHRSAGVPLGRVEADFADVHDRLYTVVEAMEEDELFGAHYYPFTGNTTLAAYVTSASAAHYRSATKLIRKWWKAQRPTGTSV